MINDKNILTNDNINHIIYLRWWNLKKSIIAKVISIILIIILILGVMGLVFLPDLYDLFKDASIKAFDAHSMLYRLAFYLCYVICLFIVYKLIGLFNVIYKKSPFRKEIERSLKVMAVMFMVLFLIVIIKSFFIPTLLSFVVAILCFLISLSFYLLAEVIKAAICYKNEVDLTV